MVNMQKLKNFVRTWMQTKGYDIVKIGLPTKIFNAPSNFQGLSYHPTPIGNYYLPVEAKEDNIANHMKRGVLFESPVIAVAKELIKPGTCVLDIGSNFGQMTIEFAKLAGPTGKVYSFEAQTKIFDILNKNIEANQLTNVETILSAVYHKDGEELFFSDTDLSELPTYGCFGIDPKPVKKGQPIKSMTIDSLNIHQPISFMKVDIQGSDLFALKGAIQTIARHKMPILFEYEEPLQEKFGTSFQDYIDFVNEIGYKFDRTILRINFLIVPK
jgi:FkbM family methyltransferase